MEEYTFTATQFESLASGYGDADAIGILLDSQIARRRLLVLAAADRIARRGGPPAATVHSALALIGEVERHAPAAGRDLFRHSFLDAWFAAGSLRADQDAAGYLAALAATAAVLAGVPFELSVPCDEPALVLPGLGTALGLGPGSIRLAGDGRSMTLAGPPGRVTVVTVAHPYTAETPSWRPVRRMDLPAGERSLVLTVDDADPYRNRYTLPAVDRLPAAEFERLRDLCRRAWQVIVEEQPRHVGGMRAILRTVVPVRNDRPGTDFSATARDAFGAVGLSAPHDPVSLAEMLLHEYQHAKIGALLDLVELVDAGRSAGSDHAARYYAPWRPDPRPAGPLLVGLHAYVGVTGFWRIRRGRADGPGRRRAELEFAYWRRQTAAALDQLTGSGELTAHGRTFASGLARTLEGWRTQAVGTEQEADRVAEFCAVADRVRWRLAHRVPDPAEVEAVVRAVRDCAPGTERPLGPGPAAHLVDLLRQAWLDGAAADEGVRALLDGDYAGAIRHASTGAVDWVLLAVALHAAGAPGAGTATRRPELLQRVADRLARSGPRCDLAELARRMETD